jgi:hypothetical protein
MADMWRGKDCETVQPGEPLRQGDVLKRFECGKDHSLWLIVSADCDIAQGKVGDQGLACIALRSLREYLLGEHLTRSVERQLTTRLRELREWIRKQHQESPGDKDPLSDGALDDWICQSSPAEIAEALSVPLGNARSFLEQSIDAVRRARAALAAPYDMTMPRLESLARLQKKPPSDWKQFVHQQLTKLQPSQLPDDAFFVTSVPGEKSLGYVAKLRSFSFVTTTSVTMSVPEARERAEAYVRIARLSATFKHGLAQQIGFLFARIGYPNEFEVEREEIFDLVVEEICNEWGQKQ